MQKLLKNENNFSLNLTFRRRIPVSNFEEWANVQNEKCSNQSHLLDAHQTPLDAPRVILFNLHSTDPSKI